MKSFSLLVNIAEKVGKVEIILNKKDNIHWKTLGQPGEGHNTFIQRTDRGKQFHDQLPAVLGFLGVC